MNCIVIAFAAESSVVGVDIVEEEEEEAAESRCMGF